MLSIATSIDPPPCASLKWISAPLRDPPLEVVVLDLLDLPVPSHDLLRRQSPRRGGFGVLRGDVEPRLVLGRAIPDHRHGVIGEEEAKRVGLLTGDACGSGLVNRARE